MENHHHEESKPTNKWISTPILMAVIVIACITGMFSLVSGQCCEGKCDEKNKTEQHGTTHGDEHGEVKNEETVADTTAATTDSTASVDGHEENSEHSHGH